MTRLNFVHPVHTSATQWGFVYATGKAESFANALLNSGSTYGDFTTPDFVAPDNESTWQTIIALTAKCKACHYAEIDCTFYNRPALLCLWKDSGKFWRGRVMLTGDPDLLALRKNCLSLALD